MQRLLTPTGYKPINEIEVGDDVLAFDMVTGEIITNQVLEKQLWNQSPETPFFNGEFYLINGEWKCYSEQSIWRNDNQVVHIKDLVVGDIVFNGFDEDVTITSIEKITDTEWYRFEISGDHSYIVDNLTLHNASRFWVGGTGTWDASDTTHWSGTSGGAGGQSVPGSGDTVTLDAASGGGTVTVATDFNVTSVTMGAFTGTLDFSANNNSPTMQTFNCSGTATRTLAMGSGTWTITGNAGIIWEIGTTTNLTSSGTGDINFTYAGATGTRTINPGVGQPSDSLNNQRFNIVAGTDTIASGNSGPVFPNFNFTGFSGTLGTGSMTNLNVRRSLTLSPTMTITYAGPFTLNGNSGTGTLTSNGKTIANAVTFNGTGGTWQLGDALLTTGTITLTNGTFNANNFNVTCGIFSSSNSNTRTLTMGSGTWTITGNNTTIWTTSTTTNLTLNAGTSTIVCNYSGSTGTRTIVTGGSSAFGINNLNVTAGTDTLTISSTFFINGNLDFTGFTGAWASNTGSIAGNLTCGAGMTTNAGNSTITFTATSSKTITTNGVALQRSFTFNGVGGTWTLQDSLNLSVTASIITLTNGTFNANNFNVTCGTFTSSNSNTRVLSMGSGTWTLTGTGTVWTTSTSTNLTLTPSTSTIVISDTSATGKTFTGGGLTYGNITFSGDNITVSGSNTFTNFRVANGGLTNGLLLTSGTTQTVSMFTTNGSAGNLAKLLSTSAGTPATLSKSSGIVGVDYMSIKDSTATGGATWYAGANSTNVSGNTGWIFSAAPSGGTTIGNNMAVTVSNAVMV